MKQSFNENWVCYRTGEKEKAFAVTLPHDDEPLWRQKCHALCGSSKGF